MSEFSAAVRRLRAAVSGDDPWEALTEPTAPPGPSRDLTERRRMGRRAYERSLEARGIPGRAARIYASANYLFEGLDD
jgi:hypothetical protein